MEVNRLALIIEDDLDTAQVLAIALEGVGFDTVILNNGLEAIKYLSESIPSLIVLDLHLPYVSGVNILKQIRFDLGMAKVPVIIVTADQVTASDVEEDVNFVLIKPLSFQIISDLSRHIYHRLTSTAQ